MSAITNIDGALTRIDNIRNNIQQFSQASLNLDNLRKLVSNATIISTTIQERIGRLFIALQQLNIDSPEVTANAQELSTLETELERVLRELSNLIPSQYPPNSGNDSGSSGNDDGGEGGLPDFPQVPSQGDEPESEPTFLTQMPTSTQPQAEEQTGEQTGGYNWRSNHRSRTKSKSRSKSVSKSVSKSHSKVSRKTRKQKKKSKKSKTRKHRR